MEENSAGLRTKGYEGKEETWAGEEEEEEPATADGRAEARDEEHEEKERWRRLTASGTQP